MGSMRLLYPLRSEGREPHRDPLTGHRFAGMIAAMTTLPSHDGRRGVALDMDGVIIDGMSFHVRAWRATYRSFYGVDLPALLIYEREGVKGTEFARQVAPLLGLPAPDEATVAALNRQKDRLFDAIFQVIPIPGVHELIDLLAERLGYPLALVTGSNRDVALGALAALGLGHCFAHVVAAGDVARGKPHPEPYLTAARRLGVAPAHCLVIENAPAGISAAQSAGMACVAVATSLPGDYLRAAGRLVADHGQLATLLMAEYAASGGVGPWRL